MKDERVKVKMEGKRCKMKDRRIELNGVRRKEKDRRCKLKK